MKKILPLLLVSIFVLSGLGAVAVPEEKQIENKPLSTQDWELEIKVNGGFLGYTVIVTNEGNETVNGNITINITTDAWFMYLGESFEIFTSSNYEFPPGFDTNFHIKPVIGFGLAKINVEVGFIDSQNNTYNATAEAKGFILLIRILCFTIYTTIP